MDQGTDGKMKRKGHLFEQVCSFDNLMFSVKEAIKGKKHNQTIARFYLNAEHEVLKLQEDLLSGRYRPMPYTCFYIYEPKKRHICAANIRDRVAHHAICHVIGGIFENSFIYDSYACRENKGAHRAVKRVQSFCRQGKYFLKSDIKKFFASIDHLILKKLIREKIKDSTLLRLMEIIIDTPYSGQTNGNGKGLPIGNLTSQWWANLYLNHFDHYIKDDLGIKKYVRYMDDFIFFSNDKSTLHALREKMSAFLDVNLKLELKERATYIAPISQGIPFLGFSIYPGIIRLKRETKARFRRNYNRMKKKYSTGQIGEEPFLRSVHSMIGHITHADTLCLRRKFFKNIFG